MLPGQIQAVYKTLHEMKLRVPTFSLDFLDSTEERMASLPAIAGALYSTHDVTDDFRRRYTDRFNNNSQISWAGFAYEFQRLVNTIGCAGTSEELLTKVRSYSVPESVVGGFTYKETEKGDKWFTVPSWVKEVGKGGETKILE